ncbi:MAG TPA: hypothetical protein VEA63_01755, partial [Opitutus sp.]|nr:hypothetical protein [Opitutus sp.]
TYFRVNHAFKAVALPSAGTHRIAFTYWPQHFTRSLVLCAVGFAILATLLVALRISRPTALAAAGAPPASS